MNRYTHSKPVKIQFAVTLTIGLISTSIAGASIYLYKTYPNFRDLLTFSATALATSVGFTAASYVSQDLKRNSEQAVIDRTLSYIERWNDPSFNKENIIGLMRKARGVNSGDKDEFIKETLKEDKLKSELILILNFFEEMSLAIHENLVEDRLLCDFFKEIVMDYKAEFSHWIDYRSETKNGAANKDCYKELKKLYGNW